MLCAEAISLGTVVLLLSERSELWKNDVSMFSRIWSESMVGFFSVGGTVRLKATFSSGFGF
jgi:hypothetical protein